MMKKNTTYLLIFVAALLLSGCRSRKISFSLPVEEIIGEIVDHYPLEKCDYDDRNLHKGRLYLNGDINLWRASKFQKELMFVQDHGELERVSLYLSSAGGDAEAAEIICNSIQASPQRIDVIVTSFCMSYACKILQSATGKRMSYPNAYYGLHALDGPNNELKGMLKEQYVITLRERTHLPEDLFPLSENLVFFNAKQALEYGFIDAILTSERGDNQELQIDAAAHHD